MQELADREALNSLRASNKNRLIVIDFYANWCGPCRTIAPFFMELSKKYSDVVFVKVNVDDAEEITDVFGISVMPTFVLEWNGEVIETTQGANEKKICAEQKAL